MSGCDLIHRGADLHFTAGQFAARKPRCHGAVMELGFGPVRDGGKSGEHENPALVTLERSQAWTEFERGTFAGWQPAVGGAVRKINDAETADRRRRGISLGRKCRMHRI